MTKALRVCNRPGCPVLTPSGPCDKHRAEAEARRGTARSRGYDTNHEHRFRKAVLRQDPLCVCTTPGHGHGPQCLRPSRHADHHPRSRDELVRLNLDPNNPQYGRGLCHSCHSSETATHQPGGWNRR